ncbi:MAG: sortase [Candidatus Heimdallarchaeaceae archaeon]
MNYKKFGILVVLVMFIFVSCTKQTTEQPRISTLKIEEYNTETINNSNDNYSGYITFWFDDGYKSTYKTAYPLLRERDWPAVLAVLADRQYATEIFYPKSIISWEDVKELQNSGWEISNHSTHHLHLNDYGRSDTSLFEQEIVRSAVVLRSQGFEIDSFTFPYGEQGGTFGQKFVSDNHTYWRSSQRGINPVPAWRHLVTQYVTSNTTYEEINEWVKETKLTKGWLILNIHDISNNPIDEWDINNSQFKELISIVENSQLRIVIPKQMFFNYGFAEGPDVKLPKLNNLENTYITIEKIDVKSKIGGAFSDSGKWDFDELEELPIWISSTPWFGYPGLSVLLGHRQWGPNAKIFARLDELGVGDSITINNLLYTVKYSIVINPNELYIFYDNLNSKYHNERKSALLLVTCTPFGTDQQRLLIVAERENDEYTRSNSST